MSIAFQHLQSLVTGDRRDLHRVQAFLKKPRRRPMPEAIEAQVRNGGAAAGAVE